MALIERSLCSDMQIDDERTLPLVASATVVETSSRPTKTAWFDKMKEKMVANPPRAPPTSGTARGESVVPVWQRQLQSEQYGQEQQHASSRSPRQPFRDVSMQSPGPSRGGPSSSRNRPRHSPVNEGETGGDEGDVEDNDVEPGEEEQLHDREQGFGEESDELPTETGQQVFWFYHEGIWQTDNWVCRENLTAQQDSQTMHWKLG
jgi:hypothetical protein